MTTSRERRLGDWARYAIYFAPPQGARLAALGAEWLSGADGARPAFASLGLSAPEIDALTAAPRRYGLHGTLKAPFRLAPGATAEALVAALGAYAAAATPPAIGPLRVVALHGFVAIRQRVATPALHARAADIVARFDRFRAPLEDAERARRGAGALDPGARALLERWGYPWVMSRFDFHLTLSGPLGAEAAERLAARLAPIFAPALAEVAAMTEIALFGDPGDGGAFQELRRLPFGRLDPTAPS